MPISTEFAPEGALEVWEFGAKGRRRMGQNLEPDDAVRLLEGLTENEERTRKMLADLERTPDPRVYKIVEHVQHRTVWEPK